MIRCSSLAARGRRTAMAITTSAKAISPGCRAVRLDNLGFKYYPVSFGTPTPAVDTVGIFIKAFSNPGELNILLTVSDNIL